MALQVTTNYETPFGTTLPGVYWRWVALSVDITTQTATGTLYAYADEAAFNSKKQPIGMKQYIVKGDDFASFATALEPALSSTIYSYVKGHDEGLATAQEV